MVGCGDGWSSAEGGGGGGAEITGASTLTGIYKETIAANDPVYVIDQPLIPAVPGAGEWELANITDLTEGYANYGTVTNKRIIQSHLGYPGRFLLNKNFKILNIPYFFLW